MSDPSISGSAIPICEHIKASGQRCGSPALRGYTRCFYHEGLERALPANRNLYTAYRRNGKLGDIPDMFFIMPELEDAASIQTAYMQILHGIAIRSLDPRRAKLMLSALHGASANLKRLDECLARTQAKLTGRQLDSCQSPEAPAMTQDQPAVALPTAECQKLALPSVYDESSAGGFPSLH